VELSDFSSTRKRKQHKTEDIKSLAAKTRCDRTSCNNGSHYDYGLADSIRTFINVHNYFFVTTSKLFKSRNHKLIYQTNVN